MCLQALEVYPHSSQLLSMLAECEERAHTLSRLRLHLCSSCKETSAAMLWLMAIKAEAMLPAGSHRVQVGFSPVVVQSDEGCCWLCCQAEPAACGAVRHKQGLLLVVQ